MVDQGIYTPTNLSTTTGDMGTLSNFSTTSSFYYQLWGHTLYVGEDSIKCATCGSEEDIPEIIQLTNGLREAVYRAYLFGKFKQSVCTPQRNKQSIVIGNNPNDGTYPYNDNLFIPNNTTINMQGDTYTRSDGLWVSATTGDTYQEIPAKDEP